MTKALADYLSKIRKVVNAHDEMNREVEADKKSQLKVRTESVGKANAPTVNATNDGSGDNFNSLVGVESFVSRDGPADFRISRQVRPGDFPKHFPKESRYSGKPKEPLARRYRQFIRACKFSGVDPDE